MRTNAQTTNTGREKVDLFALQINWNHTFCFIVLLILCIPLCSLKVVVFEYWAHYSPKRAEITADLFQYSNASLSSNIEVNVKTEWINIF